MKNALDELIERREALAARCAEQRGQLVEALDGVRRGTTPYQLALDAWQAVRSHPLVFGGVALAAAGAGPRRVVTMLGRGIAAYSLARRLWSLARRR